MKIAIISDLHANLQAWDAVLDDISDQDVHEIICLGDLVGYGPRPAEVVRSVREYARFFVMGNHDAAACELLDQDVFHGEAAKILTWTKSVLSSDDLAFLESQPLILKSANFRCAHADFSDPGAFMYLEDEEAARSAWTTSDASLMFVGHTHVPGVHVLDSEGGYTGRDPSEFQLEDGDRYIVNVGSVGMSRDGDYRACYCVYDDETRVVSWRRVDYDLPGLVRDVEEFLGGCEQVDYLMLAYQNRAEPSLREDVFQTQDISKLKENFDTNTRRKPIVVQRNADVELDDDSTEETVDQTRKMRRARAERRSSRRRDRSDADLNEDENEDERPQGSRKTVIIIISIAVIFLVLGGIGVSLFLASKKTSRSTSPENWIPLKTSIDVGTGPTILSHWPFDGNLYDVVEKNGAIRTGAGGFVPGRKRKALSLLRGSTVDLRSTSPVVLAGDYSVGAWLRLESLSAEASSLLDMGAIRLLQKGVGLSLEIREDGDEPASEHVLDYDTRHELGQWIQVRIIGRIEGSTLDVYIGEVRLESIHVDNIPNTLTPTSIGGRGIMSVDELQIKGVRAPVVVTL